MAREFFATNDNIDFGNDASINDFNPRSFSMWIRADVSGANQCIAQKGLANTEVFLISAGNLLRYVSNWTTDGNWIATNGVTGGVWLHVCVAYSHSATTQNPVFYINGVAEALTTDTDPTGTWTADATATLRLGETTSAALDFDGGIGWFVYASQTFNAATVNVARWWGRPRGDLEVYHPLVTDKLANEGSATADGTETGTTVIPAPVPVQRPGFAMMSGVGW